MSYNWCEISFGENFLLSLQSGFGLWSIWNSLIILQLLLLCITIWPRMWKDCPVKISFWIFARFLYFVKSWKYLVLAAWYRFHSSVLMINIAKIIKFDLFVQKLYLVPCVSRRRRRINSIVIIIIVIIISFVLLIFISWLCNYNWITLRRWP